MVFFSHNLCKEILIVKNVTLSKLVKIFNFRAASQSNVKVKAKDVKLLAPLTAPGKVICVGLNYRCHCNEQHIEPPHEPMFFSKFASCIVGPTDNVVLPTVSTVNAITNLPIFYVASSIFNLIL